MVEAKGFDYRRVILAGTGDAGELFVRFLVLSGGGLSHYSKFGSWGQWKSIRREKHLFNGWKKMKRIMRL